MSRLSNIPNQARRRHMSIALVFGTSHTGPYVRGHRLARAKNLVGYDVHGMVFHGDRYEPQIQNLPGRGLHFNPKMAEDIGTAIKQLNPSCLITAVMGSGYWTSGMTRHVRPFDFLVPELSGHPLTQETEMIPYALMQRRFYTDLDWQFSIVRDVQELSDLPILNLEAPPPVESEELMLKGIAQHGPTMASLEEHGLPSVSFRYKLWWGWTEVTRRISADLGLHYVTGPPNTRDAAGFLDKKFYSDGLHASDEYGRLMALEVERVMRDTGIPVQ